MKAIVVVRDVTGKQDIAEYDNVIAVETSAGAVVIKQSRPQTSETKSGLLVVETKQAEVRTLIPWHRVEQVKVQ